MNIYIATLNDRSPLGLVMLFSLLWIFGETIQSDLLHVNHFNTPNLTQILPKICRKVIETKNQTVRSVWISQFDLRCIC